MWYLEKRNDLDTFFHVSDREKMFLLGVMEKIVCSSVFWGSWPLLAAPKQLKMADGHGVRMERLDPSTHDHIKMLVCVVLNVIVHHLSNLIETIWFI